MPPVKLLNGQVHRAADSNACVRPKQVHYDYTESLDIKNLLSSISKNTEKKFQLLSYYTDPKTPLRTKCLKCNNEIEVLPRKLANKNFRCPNCSAIRRNKKIETEIFDGKDTGIKRRLTRDCEWCIMNRTYSSCPRCYYLESKTYLIDEFYNMVHPDIILKEKFSHKYKPIECECKKCGRMWSSTPLELINGYGCSACNTSRGESLVAACLDAEKVNYIKEHRFDDCRYKLPLRFDFYLPDYNAVIEYDGIQHYKPTSFHGEDPDEAYVGIKTRDKIKNDYCRKNNIKLLRIKYSTKDIDGSVSRFIKRLKNN